MFRMHGKKTGSMHLTTSSDTLRKETWSTQPSFWSPQPEAETPQPTTDYLALLRRDYEARTQVELAAIRLRPPQNKQELTRIALEKLIASCRGVPLSDDEKGTVAAVFRKMRPIEPEPANEALESARRRLGTGLHISVYINVLQTTLVRKRTQGEKHP